MTSNAPDLAGNGLAFLVYRSETDMPVGGEAVRALLETARRENLRLGLTGILHHEEGIFLQWLEGPEDAVRQVTRRICDDNRHSGMTVLMKGPLDHRRFCDWRMAYSTQEQDSILQWLADRSVSTLAGDDRRQAIADFLLACGNAATR
ncbi:BLUF domain-containing protein [Paracoccus jiaweipingae]|uniref:BLUF domain-containing protein n=1 Tax=unclassified Paracoccus (in: a-proteobacteria) TaxID=2688777 RepID=UPI003798E700